MKIIDISWPISKATTGYKDRSVVNVDEIKNFGRDGVRETNIHLSSHSGTHIDAPSHFLKEGKTIDELFYYVLPIVIFLRPINLILILCILKPVVQST